MDRGTAGCLAFATALLVGGTLATGFLPSTARYQAIAGGAIVLSFALVFLCLRD